MLILIEILPKPSIFIKITPIMYVIHRRRRCRWPIGFQTEE